MTVLWEYGNLVAMKTTIEIPDELFRAAKAKAAMDGVKLKDFVAEGLRLRLAAGAQPAVAAEKPGPLVTSQDALPLIPAQPGAPKLDVTPERIHELELEAEMERHEASLR